MASTTTKFRNRFDELNKIDVGDHIEKKNGLSYLSWAWAWTELLKRFPASYHTVYTNENGCPYFTNDGMPGVDVPTAYVKVGVTLVDYANLNPWEGEKYEKEYIEILPIMDFKNKAIPAAVVNMMDVNKTLQRCKTKAIAGHGLGAYVYAGEDLPEEDEESKQKAIDIMAEINSVCAKITSKMTQEQKSDLADNVIAPIVGSRNYKTCKDVRKLEALLNKLVNMEGGKAA